MFIVVKKLAEKGLFTVCEQAKCPNMGECWAAGTATMMVLGGICTRNCKFCSVNTGNPHKVIDLNEIENAVEMVKLLNLKYLVLTSVDRDDLKDGGANHFSKIVKAISQECPQTMVEVLVPDFFIMTVLLSQNSIFRSSTCESETICAINLLNISFFITVIWPYFL